MRYTKLTVLLLTGLLLLSSCGIIIIRRGNEVGSETESAEETLPPPPADTFEPTTYTVVPEPDDTETAKRRLAALPAADLDGLSVFFAVASETGHIFDDETDLYRTAVLQRNQSVNEKYNTKIITVMKSSAILIGDVKQADRARDYYADFAVLRGGDYTAYVAENYLHNLNSLPFTDYGAEYFDRETMKQFSVGSILYGAVGEATEQPEHYVCLYVNRDYGETVGYEIDYAGVRSGAFTWDGLLTALKALPGEAISFVSAFDKPMTAAYGLSSTGTTFLADKSGSLRLAADTGNGRLLVTKMKDLMPQMSESFSDEGKTESGFSIFTAGHALFALGTLDGTEQLENAGFRWEVLPLPKLRESDPYRTAVTADEPVIVALASSQNIDSMGYILQAVNAASADAFRAAFYEDLTLRLITGVHTLDMIDLIRENPLYDVGLMTAGSVKAVKEGTVDALYEAITGTRTLSYCLSRKETALNRYLDSLKN